ncbi:MAG: hypothetical protein ACXWZM_07325 [Solirubrobacterales bacterium]
MLWNGAIGSTRHDEAARDPGGGILGDGIARRRRRRSEVNSTVKIRSDRNGDPPPMWRNYYPHFKGTVRSGKAACEGHRDVDLYRKGPGKDLLVGGDRTNSKGKWEIVLDKPGENDYYARVLLREIGAGDCLADRSPVFHHDGFS